MHSGDFVSFVYPPCLYCGGRRSRVSLIYIICYCVFDCHIKNKKKEKKPKAGIFGHFSGRPSLAYTEGHTDGKVVA